MRLTPPFRWRQIGFAVVLGQLGGSLLLLSCVARALAFVLPLDASARVGRSIVSFIYRRCWASAERLGLMRLDLDALDALRGETGGLILAANHPTLLDAMLVVAHLPRSVCVMRAGLMRNVFLGPGARLARYIRNDSGRGMVRESVAALREGHFVVLFPEGSRTSTPPVDAFKPGITLIAKLAQVPIQTLLIRTDSPFLRKGWPLLRAPRQVVRIRVSLGKRFPASDDRRGALRQIEAYFASELAVESAVCWPASPARDGSALGLPEVDRGAGRVDDERKPADAHRGSKGLVIGVLRVGDGKPRHEAS